MDQSLQVDDKDIAFVWDLLNTIPDPEVPAISIVELGVVREVLKEEDNIVVVMTPTYSGCPAMKVMEEAVSAALAENGLHFRIRIVYKPAWTTEWMSDETKEKLRAYGIAPPPKLSFEHMHPFAQQSRDTISCPFCQSSNTTLTSRFGSTACKALYFCSSCNQPFELFKCH